MSQIKLVLADDHAVLRGGLRLMLNTQEDMEVVGEAANGEEAIHLCREIKPDIILLDLTMPGLSGLEAIEGIKRDNPATKILVLTMHDDEGYLKMVLKSGCSGYILKKAADVELISAIRTVNRGEVYIDPLLVRHLVNDYIAPPEQDEPRHVKSALSERENEVLKLIALGYTNKQIADELFLSVKTVETHKSNIKEKLNIRSRSDLVRYAIQNGLLEASE